MRQAQVFSNDVLAGLLTETDSGQYIFCYDDSFLINVEQTAISPSFPKTKKKFTSKNMFPFFYNMLSEGANKRIQCQSLKIDENDSFGLLLATAHTDTIGAITVRKI